MRSGPHVRSLGQCRALWQASSSILAKLARESCTRNLSESCWMLRISAIRRRSFDIRYTSQRDTVTLYQPRVSSRRLDKIPLHKAASHDSCRNKWTCRKTERVWHRGTFVCVCVYRWQFVYLCMFLRLCRLKLLQAKWFFEAEMEQAHFCHPVALFSHFGQHSNHFRLSEQRIKDKICTVLFKRIARDWHKA